MSLTVEIIGLVGDSLDAIEVPAIGSMDMYQYEVPHQIEMLEMRVKRIGDSGALITRREKLPRKVLYPGTVYVVKSVLLPELISVFPPKG